MKTKQRKVSLRNQYNKANGKYTSNKNHATLFLN